METHISYATALDLAACCGHLISLVDVLLDNGGPYGCFITHKGLKQLRAHRDLVEERLGEIYGEKKSKRSSKVVLVPTRTTW